MAKKKQTALLIVRNEWFTSAAIQHFFGGQHTETKEADAAPFLLAPLVDDKHPLGVWVGDMTTTAVQRKDGQQVKMNFMIPWSQILAIGIVVDESKKSLIGFKVDDETLVVGSLNEPIQIE